MNNVYSNRNNLMGRELADVQKMIGFVLGLVGGVSILGTLWNKGFVGEDGEVGDDLHMFEDVVSPTLIGGSGLFLYMDSGRYIGQPL